MFLYATASEVQSELTGKPSYSTVRAQLRVLEGKGQIRHEEEGLRYVYLPKQPRSRIQQSALKHLVETLFEGSAEKVVAALLGKGSSEITEDELPGGSISFELGGLSRDTVELRDGTVLLGDVVSLSMTAVVVRIDGSDRTYDRNRIKKLMLVEREITQRPPLTQPVPAQPKQ